MWQYFKSLYKEKCHLHTNICGVCSSDNHLKGGSANDLRELPDSNQFIDKLCS